MFASILLNGFLKGVQDGSWKCGRKGKPFLDIYPRSLEMGEKISDLQCIRGTSLIGYNISILTMFNICIGQYRENTICHVFLYR